MNYRQFIVGIVILIIVGILLNIMLTPSKLQECPDMWLQDRMLRVSSFPWPWPDNSNREWFVFNGTKVSASEVDKEWVIKNCNIQPRIVY